ncbi:membrane protein [Pedobacter mendelii]|uniref:Membrane protein n=1 Tax=Pedobacter mendelii TaxID=1908240 RepID=A0ABQ2BBP9_9SPHI|nr:membrane protein [Pedobacter mendelii]
MIAEILIAKYLHDAFIRPFGGDVLVVVLIYAFFRIFIKMNYKKLAFSVLIFSFIIEALQAVQYVNWLGFENNKFWSTILGTYFTFYDLLAYFVGYLICLLFKD